MNREGIGLCLTDPKEQDESLKKEEREWLEDIWEGVAQLCR